MTLDDFLRRALGVLNDYEQVMRHLPPGFGQITRPASADGPFIYVRVETGGYSGGSCWDDSDPQPYETYETLPTDFPVLDGLVRGIRPNLTDTERNFMYLELVVEESYTESEYYGNSTDYMYKYVDLQKLHLYLTTRGWLIGD